MPNNVTKNRKNHHSPQNGRQKCQTKERVCDQFIHQDCCPQPLKQQLLLSFSGTHKIRVCFAVLGTVTSKDTILCPDKC